MYTIFIDFSELNVAVMFDVSGDKLDKKDTFGKSDPFLEILKPSSDGSSFVPVHRYFFNNPINFSGIFSSQQGPK